MKKKTIKDVDENDVISLSWSMGKLTSFFQHLKKGSIFGFSMAFTSDQIKELASLRGVHVKLLPLSHPLRKKYGKSVMVVDKPYNPNPPIRVSFASIHFMDRKQSPGERKCRGRDCQAIILKGEEFLEITDLVDLPSGRKAYKKISLCSSCSDRYLKSKIKNTMSLLIRNPGKLEPIISQIEDL